MKEKMLKERGGAKVYVIVIVVLVILCAAIGIFAVVNMNKDKEDDEKTSKKNETNTSKTADEDKNEVDKDDDDDDSDELVKYSGTIDMAKIMGTDDLKDTVWTLSVEGNDEMLSKLVIKAELEKYLKESFDAAVGDSSEYTYEEFLELVQDTLDTQMASVGTEFAKDLGVSASKVTSDVNWVDSETLEIEVDLSKVKKSEYDVEDDESLIDYVVDAFKQEGVKMTKD